MSELKSSFISTGVEYGLHCLLFLNMPQDDKPDASVRGGFALAKRAEDIGFLDVVKAIDGDKQLFECREIRQRCAVFD